MVEIVPCLMMYGKRIGLSERGCVVGGGESGGGNKHLFNSKNF